MNKTIVLCHSGGINSSYLLHALTSKNSEDRDARFIIAHFDETNGKTINYIRNQIAMLKLKDVKLNLHMAIIHPKNAKIDFKDPKAMNAIINILDNNIFNWVYLYKTNTLEDLVYVYFGNDETTKLFIDNSRLLSSDTASNMRIVYPLGLRYGQSLFSLIKSSKEFASHTTECKHSKYQWCGTCDECKEYKDTLDKFIKSSDMTDEDIFKIEWLIKMYNASAIEVE